MVGGGRVDLKHRWEVGGEIGGRWTQKWWEVGCGILAPQTGWRGDAATPPLSFEQIQRQRN